MVQSEEIQEPKEPGWYIARMKTWPTYQGFAPVHVTRTGTADPLHVWQCGDERPWPAEAWEWRARIWP